MGDAAKVRRAARRSLRVGALSLLALVFACLATTATATELTAQADRHRLALGESLQLTVELRSDQGGMRSPSLAFDFGSDFDVVGQARGSNMQWINGQVSLSSTVTYSLRPTRAGDLTIPALTLDYRGERLTTEAIAVTVTAVPPPPTGPAPGDQPPDAARAEPLFLYLDLSKESVVVGEPLVATLYLYTRLNVHDIDFVTPPDFPGFWVEELAAPRRVTFEQVEWGGVPYNRALLLSRVITPSSAGEMTIPATVMNVVHEAPRPRRRSEPFGFSMFQRGTTRRLSAAPRTVTVRSLPPGRPASFAGAVGRFQLAAAIDGEKTPVDEPVKLVLTVRGEGNFRGISAPALDLPDGLGAFDTQEECQLTPSTEGSRGRCTYTYLIVPRRAGTFTLPPLAIAYFEPGSARYVTLETPPFRVAALAREGGSGGVTAVGRRGVELLRKEIRFLMADDALRSSSPAPWLARPLFWAGVVLPPALYLAWGAVLLALRLGGRESATGRLRRAMHEALATLAKGGDPKGVRTTLEALFSTLLNRPARGLRRAELAAALAAQGHDPALVEELLAILDDCDQAAFTPGGGDGAALAERARRGIERLTERRSAARGVAAALLIAITCVGATTALSAGADPAAARQAYEAGEYGRALDGYRLLLGEVENAPAHYNAGCAAYQAGHLGDAIYHWSRALYLDPGLEDAAANLETARLAAVDEVKEEDLPRLSWLATHLDSLAGVALAVWWGLAIVLLVALRRPPGRRDGPILATVVLMAGSVAMAALLAFGYRQHRAFPLAVVVADEVAVRSGPGESFPAVFTLHAGAPTTALATQGDWLRVRLGDRLVGWVTTRDARPVTAPWPG